MDMRETLLLIMVACSTIGLGILLHFPFIQPSLYTDIMGFFWSDFAQAGRIPYLELDQTGKHFEYPFVSGLLSIIAWRIGGDMAGFYLAYSAMVLASAIAMAYAAARLSRDNMYTLVYLAAPSLVVYGIYGYDVFLAALTALSVLAFARGRYTISAVLLALGFHTKFLSILFLPYAVLRLRDRERLKYLATFAAVALPPILAFPEAYRAVVEAQTGWSLENAWYVHLLPDAAAPVGPNTAPGLGAAILFGLISMSILYLYVLRSGLEPGKFMMLAAMSYMLFTPRYSPQTSIFLLPFIPASGLLMPGFALWELSNTAILLTWFSTPAPHMPWSLTQAMVLLRFAALSTMFIQSLHSVGLLKPGLPRLELVPKIASILRRLRT
ncbi:MAG: glycosyltransferase family 87 protein [Candidatus Caldarchaeum sp.]